MSESLISIFIGVRCGSAVLVRVELQDRPDRLTFRRSGPAATTNGRFLLSFFGEFWLPRLADRSHLLVLLDQLWPEQSTSAIVLHHSQARCFNV